MDDEGITQLLKLHLESAQSQVMVAKNGVEALRHLYETRGHVALGEEDGLVVMELLHRAQPDLPAILLAAYATLESAFAAGRRSAFDFMPKPLNQLSCYAEWRRRWKTHVAGRGIKREVR